jgi:uncharacterized protein HemY
VIAVLAALWAMRGRSRAPLAVSLLFLGTLFPVLGFVNVYPFVFSFVADHFLYVPSLGIVSGVAAGLGVLLARLGGPARWAGEAGCVVLVAALGMLTWRQSHQYRDPRTLYETTLARNSDCYLCLNNLGNLSVAAGRLDDAADQYRRALRIEPGSVEAHSNLGNLLLRSGSTSAAIEHYEAALAIAPNNVVARTNLGIAFFVTGRVPEAKAQYEAVLRIMPDYAPAQRSLELARAREAR